MIKKKIVNCKYELKFNYYVTMMEEFGVDKVISF